jgi:hypothetical protein
LSRKRTHVSQPDLLLYIRDQVSKGVPPATMKTTLMQAGWLEAEVNEAMQEEIPALRHQAKPSSFTIALKAMLPQVFKDTRQVEFFLWMVVVVGVLAVSFILRQVLVTNVGVRGSGPVYPTSYPSATSKPV